MSAVLKIYISLYNMEGAPFSSEERNMLCVIKIRSIIY